MKFGEKIIHENLNHTLKTLDTTYASKHGGSKMIDYLEKYPELVVMWAGYAFSKEYNQGRGHGHAIEDIRNILRTGDNENSPHACNLLDL